jgi:hypothetical protein
MSSLAIFGDSYADPRTGELGELSWVDLIDRKNLFNTKNFSHTGSSLWYSYKLFLNHHQEFDKIIFLVTAPNRITLPIDSNLKVWNHLNYQQAKVYVDMTESIQQKHYKLIVDYYEHIHDSHKDDSMHRLMIDSIMKIRPDAIVYPCFDFDYIKEFPLYNITKFEDQYIGITDSKRIELYKNGIRDSRSCHMTEANNGVVADMFLSRLDDIKSNLDLGKLVIPDRDLNYYYQSKFFEPYNHFKKLAADGND